MVTIREVISVLVSIILVHPYGHSHSFDSSGLEHHILSHLSSKSNLMTVELKLIMRRIALLSISISFYLVVSLYTFVKQNTFRNVHFLFLDDIH